MKKLMMSPKQMDRWKHIRTEGRVRYVLRCILITLLLSFSIGFIGNLVFSLMAVPIVKFELISVTSLIGPLIVWSIIGFYVGRYLWSINEKGYQETLASQLQEEVPTDSE